MWSRLRPRWSKITFCVSRRRREMYSGHVRLSVCLSVCLSAVACRHKAKFHYASWFRAGSELVWSWFEPDSVMEFDLYCTDPDITGEMAGDAPLCIIGRICNRCTGFVAVTTARTRNVSECLYSLVPGFCLLILNIQKFRRDLETSRRHDNWMNLTWWRSACIGISFFCIQPHIKNKLVYYILRES